MDQPPEQDVPRMPGPARQWLAQFERSRLPAINMEIVGQMLAYCIILCALVMFWVLGYGLHRNGGPALDRLGLFFCSSLLLWLGGLLWLRHEALASGLPYYARLFAEHNPLQLALGQELLTGGDGSAFRRRLVRLIRELPRLYRERGLRLTDSSPRMLLALALVLLVNFGPLAYFQSRLAQFLEFQVLALLMLIMLLNYRERVGRSVRELAIARSLLGLDVLRGNAPRPPERRDLEQP